MALSTSLLDESCGGDVKDETLPEPWNDKKYEIVYFADITLPMLGQPWLLTADPLIAISVVSQSLPRDETASVSSSTCTATNIVQP